MAVYNLGKCIPTLRGAYSANNTYYKLDIVTNEGSSFVAKQDNVHGVTPSLSGGSSHPWQVIAQKGQDITPAQINAIINEVVSQMMGQGYVSDPDYTVWKATTDALILELRNDVDSMQTPGDGILECYVNGRKITTFSANQRTNAQFYVNAESSRDLDTKYYEEASEDPAILDNLTVDSPQQNVVYLLPEGVKLLTIINGTIDTGDWKAPIEYMRFKSTKLLVKFDSELNNSPVVDVVTLQNFFAPSDIQNMTIDSDATYIFEINGPFVDVKSYKMLP